jgi:selenocysteine lyase/cysteine desulfurase
VTGWLPPIDDIIATAHQREVPVVVDAAQLAPHRPLPSAADFVAWSGHKMYAPYGAGVLIGRRESFLEGDPFLVGGGAVELVDLDEVVWSEPPEREEAGSPNVIGAVALSAAMTQLSSIGWPAIISHENLLRTKLRDGLAAVDRVKVLGPGLDVPGLPVTSFVVEGVSHALIAARLSAEYAIGVRHGCFCAHPYLVRLLDLSQEELTRFREDARQGRRRSLPGAVRASACLSTTVEDIDRLLEAVSTIANGTTAPFDYIQDPVTGDWWPDGFVQMYIDERQTGGGCARS